jgi:hypothetical protein
VRTAGYGAGFLFDRKRQGQAVQAWFHGMSASISLLGQPLAIRSSVRVSQANGSTLFIFALCISVAMVAQVRPPPSLPAKSEFFRVMA